MVTTHLPPALTEPGTAALTPVLWLEGVQRQGGEGNLGDQGSDATSDNLGRIEIGRVCPGRSSDPCSREARRSGLATVHDPNTSVRPRGSASRPSLSRRPVGPDRWPSLWTEGTTDDLVFPRGGRLHSIYTCPALCRMQRGAFLFYLLRGRNLWKIGRLAAPCSRM